MPLPAPPRRRPTALACLALALAPAAALACPTGLGAGLVYASEDGTRTTITPTDRPEVQRDRTVLPEGDGYELTAYFGLFDIETVDFDTAGAPVEDTRQTFAHAAVPGLPGPGEQLFGVVSQVVNAGGTHQRRVDAVAGPLGEVVLGGCRYQGYPIELRVFEQDGPFANRLVRVPSLGATLYVGYEDASGREDYAVVSIEALAPGGAPTEAPASK